MYFVVIVFAGCNSNSNNTKNSETISTDAVKNNKSATGETEEKMPKIVFKETTHDFGTIIKGEKVKYKFYFTNAGNADLLLTHVGASCGCTVVDYPKKAIKPGEEAFLEAVFDSTHKKGKQNKTITIITNGTPNRLTLHIKGNVVMPEKS
jgi:hypothetical protein